MNDQRAGLEEIATKIIESGQVQIRDVDRGEKPFDYTSGNRGPGYLQIKGLVGQPDTFVFLIRQLAHKVIREAKFDFVNGNVTGGAIPGWELSRQVSDILGETIPNTYLRGSKKEGGFGELITGIQNNPLIKEGMVALVVEELVNYAETTTNAAEVFRDSGYPVSHAACILSYDHAEANKRLGDHHVILVPLVTLPQLLGVAESTRQISSESVKSYRNYLTDPVSWQLERGFVIPQSSVEMAESKGYKMRELNAGEAILMGAPESKVKGGIIYFSKE